ISNTADRGQARYTTPYVGLLTPGQKYYWRIRARNDKGIWGDWSQTWTFTPNGCAPPEELRLEAVAGDDARQVLRWQPSAVGAKPARYRVYGSDEKGFSVSDQPYAMNIGRSQDVSAKVPANFIAATTATELVVLGPGVNLPNANKAFY